MISRINNDQGSYGLPIIKTARTIDAINEAAIEGFWPLIKRVIPSPDIKSKYLVRQDKRTGAIEVEGDYRFRDPEEDSREMSTVIDFTFYYPHHFESPYAAYLIPPKLAIGARVWIEDLIEDMVGEKWSQGDTFRLASCEAIWNGTDLIVQFKEKTDKQHFIG